MTKDETYKMKNLLILFIISLTWVFPSTIVLGIEIDKAETAKIAVLKKYEAAKANGEDTKAVKILLDYTEKNQGKNSPLTIKLLNKYGNMLSQDGEHSKATKALKEALSRSDETFGEYAAQAYQLNMDVGYAYGKWGSSLAIRTKYFDKALKVLRENGQHETVSYVAALISVVSGMMDSNSLRGKYSSTLNSNYTPSAGDLDTRQLILREYKTYHYLAEKYILEAIELANKLKIQDEFLFSKVAIAQAKLKVMETADLASAKRAIAGSLVSGSISKRTAEQKYDREDARLEKAIKDLSRDIEKNASAILAANLTRMDIAWMRKDHSLLQNFCANGTIDNSTQYASENIYDIDEGGNVLAFDLRMKISKNIYKLLEPRETSSKSKNYRIPYFIPVCVNGRLKAALINAPSVVVDEVN